jgi:hypothetical protein
MKVKLEQVALVIGMVSALVNIADKAIQISKRRARKNHKRRKKRGRK